MIVVFSFFASFVFFLSLPSAAMEFDLKVPDFRGHYILAHKEGYAVNTDYRALEREAFFKQYVAPILRGIDRHVMERANRNEPARILIFVHGGLNPYEIGLERVERLLKAEDKGEITHRFLGKSHYYPIFINWNSSFGSSLYDDLFEVRRGERNRLLAYPTSPFKLAARIAEAVFTAPLAWWYMGKNWLESIAWPTHEEKELRKKEGRFNQEFIKRIYAGISWFVFLPITMTTQPFIQTFGTPAWEMMKRRADLVAAKRLIPVNGHTDEGAAWILMDGMGKRIPIKDGKSIKGMWQTGDETKTIAPIEITLVGHSMGTLVIDRILQAFPEIHFKRIIYLASASSIEDFERFVAPYLNDHVDTEFWTISLFYTDEAWENEWYLVFVDRGSLLVWIDSFFENAVTPRQKRLGKISNLEEYAFRREVDGKPIPILRALFPMADIEYKKFRGREGDPGEHGDFDEREILRKIMCMIEPAAFDMASCQGAYER